MQNVQEAVAYIHARPKSGKKDSFERMQSLLEALNHPENRLPDAIHITGTNGKGSVATMVAAVAKEAGYRVGLFTSPFIIDFAERFQINGELIHEQDLFEFTKRVKKAVDIVEEQSTGRLQPTEFEVVTAIMLCYFSSKNLDLAVIEVGIGGRFDSTNILKTTKVAVITTVALDHQAMLGDTVEKIALQKAGIIKEKKPTIIGPHLPEGAKNVILEEAAKLDSLVITAPMVEYHSGLSGSYQKDNTATAVAALKAWKTSFSDEVIQRGLEKASLPGRFEEILPDIYLDGAHNQAGIHALHQAIKDGIKGPVTMIIGALADKNVDRAFLELKNDEQLKVVLVPFAGVSGRQGLSVKELTAKDQQLFWYKSVEEALEKEKNRKIVITGSLYFVSDVRRELCQKKKF